MNDKQLQSLIGMALEADELCGDASPAGRLHAARAPERSHRRMFIGAAAGLLAAGIVLAIGIGIYLQPKPAPVPPGPGPIANAGNSDQPPPEPQDQTPFIVPTAVAQNPVEGGCPDKSVVLAIYEDAPGVIRCVRWREHNWKDGRCLHEVNPSELLCAGFGSPCNQANGIKPHTLLVVALSGPKGSLPANDGDAQALATCIAHSSLAHDEPGRDPACASASVPCLPSDVTVRVESLAMSR